MATIEKINLRKSISLLLFYVAMALSIVYFDLFQAIESSGEEAPKTENLELLVQQNNSPDNSFQEFSFDQIIPQKIPGTIYATLLEFQKRFFNDNRNLAHQFKEITKTQLLVNYKPHQRSTLIISYQKMKEEENFRRPA